MPRLVDGVDDLRKENGQLRDLKTEIVITVLKELGVALLSQAAREEVSQALRRIAANRASIQQYEKELKGTPVPAVADPLIPPPPPRNDIPLR